MRRRDLPALIAGASALWPLAALAQLQKLPTIGYLSSRSAADSRRELAAFRDGLAEYGYAESRNVFLEYR